MMNSHVNVITYILLWHSKRKKKLKTQKADIYIYPKIGAIKIVYLYTSKGREFGRMEDTEGRK